ncbi:MAG: hypothetical protein ACREKS_05815 [Candidatus Rokuibacteriota bacterium]
MPTITVSDESYVALQALAEPLVDTPDTVIAKLLKAYRAPAKTDDARRSPGLRNSASHDGLRARRGEATPRHVYREALLKALRDAGGELETAKAIEAVGNLLRDRLRPIDMAKLPTGEERWINRIRFTRKDLIDQGKLDARAPHGVWRLKR